MVKMFSLTTLIFCCSSEKLQTVCSATLCALYLNKLVSYLLAMWKIQRDWGPGLFSSIIDFLKLGSEIYSTQVSKYVKPLFIKQHMYVVCVHCLLPFVLYAEQQKIRMEKGCVRTHPSGVFRSDWRNKTLLSSFRRASAEEGLLNWGDFSSCSDIFPLTAGPATHSQSEQH